MKAVDGAGNLSLNYSNTASATPQVGTNLVTAYGMNEGSGTTLADASGTGHTGTLVNGPAWVAGQATYGQALSFDGVNDAVSVANPGHLQLRHGGLYDRTLGQAQRGGRGPAPSLQQVPQHRSGRAAVKNSISKRTISWPLAPSPPATPSPARSPIRTGTMSP